MDYNKFRRQISNGDVFEVIQTLIISLNETSLKNEVILLSASYNSMLKNVNILTYAEKHLQFMSISQSLLTILDKLEKELSNYEPTIDNQSAKDSLNQGNVINLQGASIKSENITIVGGDAYKQ